MTKKSIRWKLIRLLGRRRRRTANRAQRARAVQEAQLNSTQQDDCNSPSPTVFAPRAFEIETEGGHGAVSAFLSDLRRAFNNPTPRLCIDFTATEKMVAGGTLLLFSELNRLVEIFPKKSCKVVRSRDQVVNQVLSHLGLFSLLGSNVSVPSSRQDVVNWRTASSSVIDGDQIGPVIDQYRAEVGPATKHLFRGVSEAMNNAVNHAYISHRKDGLGNQEVKKWWMFCRRDEGRLIVALCDLGIGIPRSLPIMYSREALASAVSLLTAGRRPRDALMIQAAMEISRTRTATLGRGRGLGDFRRLVDEKPGSSLYLFSNRGLVKYRNGTYFRYNYRRSILGTLVLWIIPVEENPDE